MQYFIGSDFPRYCRNRRWVRWETTPCPEKHPDSRTLSIVTWRRDIQLLYNNFWYEYFWHSWPSYDRSILHLTQCLFLHYLGKAEPTKYELKRTKIRQNHSQHYRLWLEKELTDFDNFCCKHFWHYFPSNDLFSSHITECLFLHYL